MPAFEPRSDPTIARWTRWQERFNTYLLAADIKDDARKRALLWYQAGPEVHEFSKPLEEGESKDSKSAVKALTELRKKALQDPKYSLANMLIDGRKYETSSAQAVGIEQQFQTRENINATVMATPTEKKCYYCGFENPHDNQPCPGKSAICNHCRIKRHFPKVCRTRGKSFASKGNLEKLQTQGFTSLDKMRQSRWDENKQRKQQAK
ncbi:Hypothetical predicted protein [Paramuricea clavata]|uniref:Uncharacterized protein n=1 Tax=Paramuricea clavata TaxID=317549 RepID=A0A7D9E4T5_PARCT|nr:Hypothetical predicted protein [Paramuricea clavata]